MEGGREGGGRGESKNLRKISGVVEEEGWWGWVNLPELGRGGKKILGLCGFQFWGCFCWGSAPHYIP